MTLFRSAGTRSMLRNMLSVALLWWLYFSRFIVRDFIYSEEEIAKQRQEMDMAGTTEKELWVCRSCLLSLEQVLSIFIDWALAISEDQLFGIIPNLSTSEGPATVRWKCSTIWPSSRIYWSCGQGEKCSLHHQWPFLTKPFQAGSQECQEDIQHPSDTTCVPEPEEQCGTRRKDVRWIYRRVSGTHGSRVLWLCHLRSSVDCDLGWLMCNLSFGHSTGHINIY